MPKRKRPRNVEPADDPLTKIKRLAVVAMFSDDELLETLGLPCKRRFAREQSCATLTTISTS
jgi:hypothetical protein